MRERIVRIHWKAFSIQKQGNPPDENEDAFRPDRVEGCIPLDREFNCALSDGATQTTFSGLWANLLVSEAARQPVSAQGLQNIVRKAQKQWDRTLSGYDLPWHAEEKVKQGAHATLVWLSLKGSRSKKDNGGSWRAIAVGDSCLFQVRNNQLKAAFPIAHSTEFGNRPVLLPSLSRRNPGQGNILHDSQLEGTWEVGDEIFLATDAFAAWFLEELENGSTPVQTVKEKVLKFPDCQRAFDLWIKDMRRIRAIKNDDTTLIRIRMGQGS